MDVVNGKAAAAGFDASALEIVEGSSAEIEIYDNAGNGTGIFISIVSSESEEVLALKRKLMDRRLARMRRQGGRAVLSSVEIEAEAMDVRVACTKGWRGMFWHGEELKCTPDNLRMIYTKAPTIRSQVDDGVSDATLFTKG